MADETWHQEDNSGAGHSMLIPTVAVPKPDLTDLIPLYFRIQGGVLYAQQAGCL
jgi:hypothetical protein